MNTESKKSNIVAWAFQLVAAIILGQTLFYKFSASEESVYIFETIGIEPWGRIGTGLAELIAVILLLYSRTISLGALLGLLIMLGAVASHLTILGIEVKGDGGLLFALALTTLLCCSTTLFLRRAAFARLVRGALKRV